jgi:phage gp45-like
VADSLMRSVQKLLDPLRSRVKVLFSRGVLHLSDASGGSQKLQVELQPGEVLNNVEHLEPYGFTSRPLAGAEVASASIGGDRSRTVVLFVADRRYRKKNLVAGEAAFYTDEGDYILLKRGRIVEVVAGTRVKVTAPDVEIVGNATVSGTLTVAGAILSNTSIADPAGTLAEARGYYNGHSHPGGVVTPQMT